MPDIDPAALSRSGTGPQASTAFLPPLKPISTSVSTSQKPSKMISFGQRIDLEPLYTALKAAIGEHWVAYKEAMSLFVLGHLNQAELSSRIDHFIVTDTNKEHLHNQLIAAIYGNVTRDLPDHGVASWVSANDKPTNVSKPVSGDMAEQRLKMEIMCLPARDRRRLKDIPEIEPFDMYSNMLSEYHQAKQIKAPDVVPVSAGGLNKTNWDIEIRKRYAQPLACETGEFPDTESIQNRIIPICYEEGIVGGATDGSASYMNVATEMFIKEVLSGILERTRSNGPQFIMTSAYRNQLEREEEAWSKGELQKNSNMLLPIEQAVLNQRPPLGMADFRLALELGDSYLGHMPLTIERIMGDYYEGEFYDDNDEMLIDGDESGASGWVNGVDFLNGINDHGLYAGGDDPDTVMLDDSSDWGWEGVTPADRQALDALLDECLAIGQ